MTDLEKLIQMLDEANIVYKIEENKPNKTIEIYVTAQDGPNNLGYSGFASNFTFNQKGKLLSLGAYE